MGISHSILLYDLCATEIQFPSLKLMYQVWDYRYDWKFRINVEGEDEVVVYGAKHWYEGTLCLRKRERFLKMKRSLLCLLQTLRARAPSAPSAPSSLSSYVYERSGVYVNDYHWAACLWTLSLHLHSK